LRQRPAEVSQTGSSAGQQCVWSSQQVALGSGQQAQVKQYPKKSRRQQHVAPAEAQRTVRGLELVLIDTTVTRALQRMKGKRDLHMNPVEHLRAEHRLGVLRVHHT